MKKIFPVLELATKLAIVKRTTGYRKDHSENDSEHSYQLALAAWCANEQYNLQLNNELILKLALVHDLVEIYAGDTDAHDKKKILSKKENEKKALEKINLEYIEFKELLNTIELYEKQESSEANLVFFLDKIIPDVNIYNSNSNYYQDRKVTYAGWVSWLFGRINYDYLNPKLKLLVDESIEEVKNSFNIIFYKE